MGCVVYDFFGESHVLQLEELDFGRHVSGFKLMKSIYSECQMQNCDHTVA